MTDAAATPGTDAAPEPPRKRGPARPLRWAMGLLAGLLLLLVAAAAVVRLGVRTDAGRAAAVRAVEGMRLGPIGRLHVEGLEGDLFDAFRLRRLTIADAQGVWLDGRDLAMSWRPSELLARRVHARTLTVGDLLVLRPPVLEKRPPAPPEPAPVGVVIDALKGRLRTGKALTVAQGDWDVAGALDFRRSGRTDAKVAATSRLHAGDHLNADLRMTDARRLSLKLDALEAAGGGLAGGLGLAADQPFALNAEGVSDDKGGRLHVDSRSGALRPLYADGRWTAAGGGHVEAHALLAASTHLAPYVLRFGPRADAVLEVARQGGLYGSDLKLTGDLTQAHAVGPVDFAKLSTPGLKLDVTTKSVGAWFHPPVIGAAHATGVLVGSIRKLQIRAQAAAQDLNEIGLTIARLNGPVTVDFADGEWRIRTEVQGEGTGGEGVLPPLLGPRPTARIDLSFLKDRRLLFRELHVVGQYVKADATGAQDLLGGLGFQGTATAPSLKGMLKGSDGAAQAGFKASAPKGSAVWAIAVEARGQRFKSGVIEFDRLLGISPRLTLTGTQDPDGFHLARGVLTGDKASGTARGLMATDKTLAFDVDWTAQGPFPIGPLEIDGQMTGKGKVSGTIGVPQADLYARLVALDLDRLVVKPADVHLTFTRGEKAMDGRIEVAGPSNYGPARARAAFRTTDTSLDLTDVDADAGGVKLAGAVSLRDGEPSTADLTIVAGPGAFLATGKLSGAVRIAAAGGSGSGSGCDHVGRTRPVAPRLDLRRGPPGAERRRSDGPAALPVERGGAGGRALPVDRRRRA